MSKKLTGKTLATFEAKRDMWQEVLAGVREIKVVGGRGRTSKPRPTSVACDSPRNCSPTPIPSRYGVKG